MSVAYDFHHAVQSFSGNIVFTFKLIVWWFWKMRRLTFATQTDLEAICGQARGLV
jgi:hypothetical protein